MEKKTIGIAITGSFCTFDKMTGVIKTLTASGMRVIPIFPKMYNIWIHGLAKQKISAKNL